MQLLNFKQKIRTAADFLISKQNPDDGGWGLNIEKGFQASSIVNTAESLFVINRAGKLHVSDSGKAIGFLKEAIVEHPKSRGNNLRYFTFGIWGLLEAGLETSDPFIISTIGEVENRLIISKHGWSEQLGDTETRIWATFQALWMIIKVYGADYVRIKYHKCFNDLINLGRKNQYKWGFNSISQNQSLAATSYALILLSEVFPGTPDVAQSRKNVSEMLNSILDAKRPLEVEAIAGTDWNHYSYCWALKALHSAREQLDESIYLTSIRTLKYIDTLFYENGYIEPDKHILNVRSIFNNVLAIDGVIANFDPTDYLFLDEIAKNEACIIMPKSVFLSYSFRQEDKELVEGLEKLLESAGYIVITGEKNRMGSISKKIMNQIKEAENFLVVMTRRDKKDNGKYTTSSWILEEKGAAIALGKPCLMLIEEGVDEREIGGLQGDDEWIPFTRNNFASKIADAIRMLGN